MDQLNRNRSPRRDRDDSDWEAEEGKRQPEDKKKLDDQLDKALEDSFPGSDPVSVTQPPPSARDKHQP